jgi:hypothetical protein
MLKTSVGVNTSGDQEFNALMALGKDKRRSRVFSSSDVDERQSTTVLYLEDHPGMPALSALVVFRMAAMRIALSSAVNAWSFLFLNQSRG